MKSLQPGFYRHKEFYETPKFDVSKFIQVVPWSKQASVEHASNSTHRGGHVTALSVAKF